MRSVVWTGHLHFGLVVLPVSLFAAARAETTRFKRIHRRKKVAGSSFGAVDLPWSTEDDFENAHIPSLKVHHGFGGDERGAGVDASRPPVDDSMLAETGSAPIAYEYAPVRQVLQSETTGEEVRSEDLVKGYQYGTNEFAVIEPAVIERPQSRRQTQSTSSTSSRPRTLIPFISSVHILWFPKLAAKRLMRCCWKPCVKKATGP